MKVIFTVFFAILSFQLLAQKSVSGKVTDQNNTPLEGVDIYSPNLHRGTTTNSEGDYSLNNLPGNTVKLVFTYIGYKTVSKSLSLDEDNVELNLALEESVFEMDEIIISTPFHKLQSENVMKVDHKTIRQLQLEGATSLVEGISKIPGLSQISTGSSIGKPVIRGLNSNRVLVYSQGVRLENQQFGDEHGLGLNELGVESVEVIKGPASLLYGSDALGGVLYFNPEKFSNAQDSEIKIRQTYNSNTSGLNSSVLLKGSTDKLKLLGAIGYQANSDYKISNSDRVTNTRFNELDLKAGLGYDIKNYSTDIRFNYNRSKLGLTEGIDDQNLDKTPLFPYQNIDNYLISSHNHLFFKDSKLDLNLGYILNNRQEFEEEDDQAMAVPELFMKLKTFNYDLKYHLPKKGNFESIIGVQGLFQNNTNLAEELLIPNAEILDFGILATSSYQVNEHYFQGGLRFDHRNIQTEFHQLEDRTFESINKSYQSVTASLGYKHTFVKILELRLNLASGFRAPNLAELASNGVHEGTNRYEIGNSDLKTEKNLQIDLALEFNNEHFEVFANGFYNTINDFIFIAPTGTSINNEEVFSYNQQNAALYGGEIGLHLHPHPLDWLHLETSFDMVIGRQKNKDYLPLIPANKLKNALRTEFKINSWLTSLNTSLNLESIFKQNKVSPFETSSPGYNLLHFSTIANIQLEKFKFNASINVNNMLNTEYISHLSRLKSEGIPNIGRVILFGINFVI